MPQDLRDTLSVPCILTGDVAQAKRLLTLLHTPSARPVPKQPPLLSGSCASNSTAYYYAGCRAGAWWSVSGTAAAVYVLQNLNAIGISFATAPAPCLAR
ncbi:MAG: hypothetical protein WKF84_00985 [Pyrinomonadaceae bacterium]